MDFKSSLYKKCNLFDVSLELYIFSQLFNTLLGGTFCLLKLKVNAMCLWIVVELHIIDHYAMHTGPWLYSNKYICDLWLMACLVFNLLPCIRLSKFSVTRAWHQSKSIFEICLFLEIQTTKASLKKETRE